MPAPTRVDAETQILRQPSFHARFAEGTELHIHTQTPVLVRTEGKTITFAVDAPADAVIVSPEGRIDLEEFTLLAPGAKVEQDAEGVTISLLP